MNRGESSANIYFFFKTALEKERERAGTKYDGLLDRPEQWTKRIGRLKRNSFLRRSRS